MRSDTALKPITFNVPSLIAQKQAREEATDEEKLLFSMSRSAGWKIFSETAGRVCKEIEEVNKKAIESGAPFEEIGRNTLIITMTQDIITKLLNKVSDAVEACENGQPK